MNGEEPEHFSKEWFWDDGLLPILKGIKFLYSVFVAIVISPVKVCIWLYHHRLEVFKKGINFLLYTLFDVFVIFPINVCVWLYHHGLEAFRLAFWFFIWFSVPIWIITIAVSISDRFIITSIDDIEIYGVILLVFLVFLVFLYAYFKYAKNAWCNHTKYITEREIYLDNAIAQMLFEEEKFNELTEHCDWAISKNPTSIHILFWVAVAKYKQGRLETSLELFENLAAIYPIYKKAEDAMIQEKISSIGSRLPIDFIKEQYRLRLFDKGEIDFYLERIKQELRWIFR